jgi:F0F1-type ATP synthase delta subunit
VPEQHLRVHDVQDLHQAAAAAEHQVEREVRLAIEVDDTVEQRIGQRLIAELQDALEISAPAGPA